jgi:hypothetical protein
MYFVGVLTGASVLGPETSWPFLAAWSAVFAWSYVMLLHGRGLIAVSIVIGVTIVLPLVALIAIAWPAYRSWSALYTSLWPGFEDRGALGNLEFIAPPVAALLCVAIARYRRSASAPAQP